MIHLPSDFCVFMMSHIYLREFGSKPEDGSSKNIILASPIKALAKHNFLLLPPERFLLSLPFYLAREHFWMTYYMAV